MDLQSNIWVIFYSSKPTKVDSLHLTIATIKLHEVEFDAISRKIKAAVQQYINMVNSSNGLVVISKA